MGGGLLLTKAMAQQLAMAGWQRIHGQLDFELYRRENRSSTLYFIAWSPSDFCPELSLDVLDCGDFAYRKDPVYRSMERKSAQDAGIFAKAYLGPAAGISCSDEWFDAVAQIKGING